MKKLILALPLAMMIYACDDDDKVVSKSGSASDTEKPVVEDVVDTDENTSHVESDTQEDNKVYDYRNEPTVWLSGDYRFDIFPQEHDTIVIFSDGINPLRYFTVTDKARLDWSKNIKEIGEIFDFSFNNNVLKLGHLSYACAPLPEAQATKFDDDHYVIKAQYFQNMVGKYDAGNYQISVEAKLCVSTDVLHYWNANIVDIECDENGVYTCLLAHSSSANGAGSIDPGITGKEPFVSKQGNFWSWCQFVPSPGSQWELNWSSLWSDSPYEALQKKLDCSAKFQGPATTKLTYKFSFYYGNPALDESGWCTVDKGAKLCDDYIVNSDVPLTFHLSDFKDLDYQYDEQLTSGYWWYSTNSITSIESSYVYKISETTDLFLTEYEIYLTNQEKVVSAGEPLPEAVHGTFVRAVNPKTQLVVSGNSITYDDVEYSVIDYKIWQPGDKMNGYAVLMTDGTDNYALYLSHYYTVEAPYIKVKKPGVYDGELPDSYINSDNSTNWNIFGASDRANYVLNQ